jgi:acyl-CoA thioesterase I
MAMKIVCFGDSLTEGYQSSQLFGVDGFTPYGRYLQEWLGNRGTVWVRGVCGELTGDMQIRFARDVIPLNPDYVVILGGTNDLGWGLPPSVIVEHLVRMYAEAVSLGIQPVGITVPSLGGMEDVSREESPHAQAIQEREAVNSALKRYCRTAAIPLVDLFTTTCDPRSKELAAPFSEDGLHLTTLGYYTLAELLWKQVFSPRIEGHE